ncbi:hypothetical protein ABZP36_017396 [Zizania latifolia]
MDHSTSQPLPDLGSFSYSWPTNRPLQRADDGGEMDCCPARQCSFDFSLPPFECAEQAAEMADADQVFRDGLILPLRVVRRQGGREDDGVRLGGAHKQDDDIPVLLRSRSLDSSQSMTMVSASKRHRLAGPVSLNSSPSSLRGAALAPAWPSTAVLRASKLRMPSFGRCGRLLPRRLSRKYLSFLAPLYQKMVSCVRWRSTTMSCVRWRSTTMSCVRWRSTTRHTSDRAAAIESCNGQVCEVGTEDAIRDAILHCKKSL